VQKETTCFLNSSGYCFGMGYHLLCVEYNKGNGSCKLLFSENIEKRSFQFGFNLSFDALHRPNKFRHVLRRQVVRLDRDKN